jgi:hypothetical protein|nr:MAG TPA: hypothetical protein [Caudoviricetes sp.]
MLVEKTENASKRTTYASIREQLDDAYALMNEARADADDAETVDTETGEVKPSKAQAAQAAFDSINASIVQKLAAAGRYVQKVAAEIATLEAHIEASEKILARLKRLKDEAERGAIQHMREFQYDRITDPNSGMEMHVKAGRESVKVKPGAVIPLEFMKIKSITGITVTPGQAVEIAHQLGSDALVNFEPSKKALAAAIKSGVTFEGVEIIRRPTIEFSK